MDVKHSTDLWSVVGICLIIWCESTKIYSREKGAKRKEKKEEKNVVHNLTQVDNFHDQNQN